MLQSRKGQSRKNVLACTPTHMIMPTSTNILSAVNLSKTYQDKQNKLRVLERINFNAAKAERVAITGRSGSGKSTLLSLLGGIDTPSSGHVLISGQDLHQLGAAKKDRLLNQELGFVYQFHYLLPEFTALENVTMPLLIGKTSISAARKAARSILHKVGLSERLQHRPAELSGGERQRVAIARALVHHPSCVFMDEPTGNLDKTTALDIQKLIRMLNIHYKTAFICATHDMEFADSMDRVLQLEQGKLMLVK